ncbi:CPBP family intramembrane metalloprotease [Rhodopirellula sp. JC740]|uniref:CPBP family intramembrane metalloprotease n=1 Tax=Rhodopirellula halodulae TaxID=2894198 RepID=A0ABS8NKK7_9BACT|nr:CPBP family intramembrane metalloprotease [Rhodopirellula sp. JC740]
MSQASTDEEQTPDDVFRTAVMVEAGLGALALVLGYFLGPSARDLVPPLSEGSMSAVVGGIGLGIVATIPLLLFVAVLRRIKHPAIEELDKLSDHPMIGLMLKLNAWELFAISLCAGVGEELLFRGWLMPWLAGDAVVLAPDLEAPPRWWAYGGWLGDLPNSVTAFAWPEDTLTQWWSRVGGWELTAAWLVSSFAFGMFHPITKLYIAITALMGLYFGVLLIMTGNLLIPITAHALYDAVQLWGAGRSGNHSGEDDEKSSQS